MASGEASKELESRARTLVQQVGEIVFKRGRGDASLRGMGSTRTAARIVGSIANIIVVDAARKHGIAIGWQRHARTGVPVTIVTLGITAAWITWRAGATVPFN